VAQTLAVIHLAQLAVDPQSLSRTRPMEVDSDLQQQQQLQPTGCWQLVPHLQDEQAERLAHPAPDNRAITDHAKLILKHLLTITPNSQNINVLYMYTMYSVHSTMLIAIS